MGGVSVITDDGNEEEDEFKDVATSELTKVRVPPAVSVTSAECLCCVRLLPAEAVIKGDDKEVEVNEWRLLCDNTSGSDADSDITFGAEVVTRIGSG